MKHSLLSSQVVVGLALAASVACSPDNGVTRQDASGGNGGNGGSAGAATGGAGSGGTAGGSAGSGGIASGAGGTAGTAGTGGAGAGGAAGGTSGAGGTAGSPGVGCTGTELFCEDFEDTATGEVPGTPWLALAEYCPNSSDFATEVTGDLFHGGTKAFKATNDRPPNCRLSAPFPDSDDFWIRAFIYWEESVSFSGKEILAIDLHGAAGINTDDPAVRFGSRSKEPCTASAGPQITLIGLAGGEQTGCNGTVQEPKNEWYCFEAHVSQPGALSVKTYINGAGFTYESSGKAPTETIDTPSAPAQKINHVRIGFFTNDGTGAGNVYIDDLAISTTRLNCGN